MGPGVRKKTDREPGLGGVRAEPVRARTRTPNRDAEGSAASARARPPGLNLPPPAAGARHLHARVRRGTGCGSGPVASRGSRAAAAAGTGAGTDLRAAKRDPRWRRTGASRLQRRGESLRPPGAPLPPGGGQAAPPPPSPAYPAGGQTLGSRGDALRWRRGGRCTPRAHAVSQGLAGPCGLPPGRGPGPSSPGQNGPGVVFSEVGALPDARSCLSRWPPWRTRAGARGLFGRFSRRWRSLPSEQMFTAL